MAPGCSLVIIDYYEEIINIFLCIFIHVCVYMCAEKFINRKSIEKEAW